MQHTIAFEDRGQDFLEWDIIDLPIRHRKIFKA